MSDDNTDITANYHGGDPHSVAAFESLGSQRRLLGQLRIVSWLREHGPATCEELEQALKLSHQTCSARVSELRRAGRLIEVGRAYTSSGRTARVHALAPDSAPTTESEGP